jgi:hypothetical protein
LSTQTLMPTVLHGAPTWGATSIGEKCSIGAKGLAATTTHIDQRINRVYRCTGAYETCVDGHNNKNLTRPQASQLP